MNMQLYESQYLSVSPCSTNSGTLVAGLRTFTVLARGLKLPLLLGPKLPLLLGLELPIMVFLR